MFKTSLKLAVVGLTIFYCSCDSDSSDSVRTGLNPIFTPSPTTPPVNIDAELQQYLNTFITEAAARNVTLNTQRMANLTLKFGPLDPGTLGECATDPGDLTFIEVVINETLRGSNPEWTTIHELGHCILRMEHRDDVLSIMNAFDSDAQLDAANRVTIFDEFFDAQYFEQF